MTKSGLKKKFQQEYHARTDPRPIKPRELKTLCYHWFLLGNYYRQGLINSKRIKYVDCESAPASAPESDKS